MNSMTRVAVGILAIVGGIGPARPAPVHAQHPDLSGRWTYNPTQSDNPRDMRQAGDTGGGGGGGGGRHGGYGSRGGGGHGGGHWGGGGGGGMTDEQRARLHETMSLALDAPQVLTLSQ